MLYFNLSNPTTNAETEMLQNKKSSPAEAREDPIHKSALYIKQLIF